MARWRWKDAVAAFGRRPADAVAPQPRFEAEPAPAVAAPVAVDLRTAAIASRPRSDGEPEPAAEAPLSVDLHPVAWPWDPVFRPTVGVFAEGRLVGVLPTARQRTGEPGEAAGWSCVVDRAAAVRLAPTGTRVELRCLETDERLTAVDDAPTGLPDARTLIALSRRYETPPRLDGFTAFLCLPTPEQVSLVFFCILGRPAQEGDRAMVDAVFNREGGSILDLRDRLLTNRNFVEGRMATGVPLSGHWLCWPGLAAARDHILFAPAVGVPGLWRPPMDLSALPPPDFAEAMARMALGAGHEADVTSRWVEDHASALAELRSKLVLRRPARNGARPSSTVLDFGHALGGMTVAAGGSRNRAAVLFRPGHFGDVLYGPYAKLPAGRYSVTFRMKAYSTETGPGQLFLEVVAAELILAGTSVRVTAAVTDVVTLAFTVPAGLPAISASGLEYRLRSDGRVRGLVEDVRVMRLSRTGQETLAAPEVDDWLPLLSLGGAGAATTGGIAGPADLSGFVFFGPFRALLPGTYRLVVAFEATLAAGEGAGGDAAVLLEVVDGKQQAIASGRILLVDGVSSVALPFTQKEAADGALPGKLEFRLRKEPGYDLLVTNVRVEARPPEEPSAINVSAGGG